MPITAQHHKAKTKRRKEQEKGNNLWTSKCEIIMGPKSQLLSSQNDDDEQNERRKSVSNTFNSIHIHSRITQFATVLKLMTKWSTYCIWTTKYFVCQFSSIPPTFMQWKRFLLSSIDYSIAAVCCMGHIYGMMFLVWYERTYRWADGQSESDWESVLIVVYFIILSMATISPNNMLRWLLINVENCFSVHTTHKTTSRRYLFAIDVSITKTHRTNAEWNDITFFLLI